ncbi:MAG: TIGR02186 family protein [Pseudomonadota bacterium]|nr:TIGR02186 family protein [Pseudomonadota bacterium]
MTTVALPPPALLTPTPPAISAALTDTSIQVTSSFRGARIVLYGAVFDPLRAPHDVVVVVRGPEEPVRIVRKLRVAGLWLNTPPATFRGAPGYYMAASTRPLAQIAGFAVRRRLRLGVENVFLEEEQARSETRYGVPGVLVSPLGQDYYDYRRAVVRLKQREGLYAADSDAVRWVDQNLFRADVALPAAAPTGRYEADIHLFRDGRQVALRTRTLTVEKVGVERVLYVFAHERPWTYGVVSVLFAIAAGWLASVVFRRR